jgi:hypothetical protein
MPATVTLSSTTLSVPVDRSANEITLASVSGLYAGTRLFVDGELMRVISVGVGTLVNVSRGVDGTAGVPHSAGATVYVGNADQFYSKDPQGIPPAAIPVSPYINLKNGRVWFARGDAGDPSGNSLRWWQQQTVTYTPGALGVTTTTLDPTAST